MAPFAFAAPKTALITGGASGIGLAVAQKCLGHGMKVLIADRNATQLAAAKQASGDALSTVEMDVAREEDWAKLQRRVDTDFKGVHLFKATNTIVLADITSGRLDFLFLNAGIQPSSGWDSTASFRTIFDANFYGVVNGIAAFLPTVKATPDSAIVVTGSKQGITNPPGNPAYNASKSAVKTMTEHLSYDLKGTDTSIHLLVPGWTFTGLGGAAAGGEKPAAAWTAQQVAEYLEEKMAKDEFYILCPDNEVTEEMDAKRMTWATQDLVQRRPPLSRWRQEFKDEFSRWSQS